MSQAECRGTGRLKPTTWRGNREFSRTAMLSLTSTSTNKSRKARDAATMIELHYMLRILFDIAHACLLVQRDVSPRWRASGDRRAQLSDHVAAVVATARRQAAATNACGCICGCGCNCTNAGHCKHRAEMSFKKQHLLGPLWPA